MAVKPELTELLPPAALEHVRVGVSVSESPDLGRLGLAEIHLRLTLGEIARVVLRPGGRLVYGGHLDPTGYTAFLQGELEKYAQPDQPLVVCLAWSEHRRLSLADLERAEESLGLFGEIIYLDPDGAPIYRDDGRGEAPEPVTDQDVRVRALTGLRRYLVCQTNARVLVGGKRTGYQGAMPGIIEEALIAIAAAQPIFLAAGFGGATWDAASVLGLIPGDWPDLRDGAPDGGLAELKVAAQAAGWRPDLNGLSEVENLRLAASHRPSEIASLVALGLGRLHG